MLARFDATLDRVTKHLRRSVSATILDHVTITTSGNGFFSIVPFMAALHTFGADRILFPVDYPFSTNGAARTFLDALPVAPADKEKIAHGNADRFLKLA
jgi:predicted TIM-barrel fold metal-dependent hydrolase